MPLDATTFSPACEWPITPYNQISVCVCACVHWFFALNNLCFGDSVSAQRRSDSTRGAPTDMMADWLLVKSSPAWGRCFPPKGFPLFLLRNIVAFSSSCYLYALFLLSTISFFSSLSPSSVREMNSNGSNHNWSEPRQMTHWEVTRPPSSDDLVFFFIFLFYFIFS